MFITIFGRNFLFLIHWQEVVTYVYPSTKKHQPSPSHNIGRSKKGRHKPNPSTSRTNPSHRWAHDLKSLIYHQLKSIQILPHFPNYSLTLALLFHTQRLEQRSRKIDRKNLSDKKVAPKRTRRRNTYPEPRPSTTRQLQQPTHLFRWLSKIAKKNLPHGTF